MLTRSSEVAQQAACLNGVKGKVKGVRQVWDATSVWIVGGGTPRSLCSESRHYGVTWRLSPGSDGDKDGERQSRLGGPEVNLKNCLWTVKEGREGGKEKRKEKKGRQAEGGRLFRTLVHVSAASCKLCHLLPSKRVLLFHSWSRTACRQHHLTESGK